MTVCKGGYGGEGVPIGGYAPMPKGGHVNNFYPSPPIVNNFYLYDMMSRGRVSGLAW
jgi:hypothetical protein